MSPMLIILLILILSIPSVRSSISKNYETNKNANPNNVASRNLERRGFPDHASSAVREIERNRNFSSEIIRGFLVIRMATIVEKMMKRRRWKEAKKWKLLRGKKRQDDHDSMMDENEIAIWKFPALNDPERGKDGEPDERYYKPLIGRENDGIRGAFSQDLPEVSATLIPLVRGNVDSRIRKVRAHFARIRARINDTDGSQIQGKRKRAKRAIHSDAWIKRDFKDRENTFKMHALVVRDEDIPPCCSTAKEVTTRRYFMCSGSLLTLKHAITTASCMHFADIYKHEIEADLGILVGATNPRAYVIKINRYEMHPNYNYDVDSKNHATNNVAIIYLECSIVSRDVAIPQLPKGINDDVAHMCCGENCHLFTIVQSHDNRHTARVMKAKHLPAPRHNDEVFNDHESSNAHPEVPVRIKKHPVPNETFVFSRSIRSPPKIAKVPFLFGTESRRGQNSRGSEKSMKSLAKKTRSRFKTPETLRTEIPGRVDGRNDPLKLRDFFKRAERQDVRSKVEKELAAVDWADVEDTMSKKLSTENRKVIEHFARNIVDETIKRLGVVLEDEDFIEGSPLVSNVDRPWETSDNKNGSFVFSKLMPNKDKNKTINSFVKVFTDVVTSLLPPNIGAGIVVSSDVTLEEKDLDDPPPIYEDCPPLGAPIIINETLVALVAYTCDDAQSWVEWKYVNMVKNMNWLRDKISEPYEPAGKCTEIRTKSIPASGLLPEEYDDVRVDMNAWMNNQTGYRDENVEWTSGENGAKRRDVSSRNFDNVRITRTYVRAVGDPWFSGNSQPAPGEHSNPPKITVVRNAPVYNYNTCYVKTDGSIDCETRSEANFR